MTTNTEATKAGDLLTITQHLILWRNRAATSRKWDRGEEVDLLGRLLEKLEAAALRTTPRPAEPALAAEDAKPAAWVTPLHYGEQVTFYKPPAPAPGEDDEWYCYPLFRHPAPSACGVADSAADGCLCHGCGIRYRGDLNIPDDVWAKISNGDNLLCASCIARRIIEAGIWTAIRGEDVDLPEPAQSADTPTWQPIETAPKNETLLLHFVGGVICSGRQRYGFSNEPQQNVLAWRCDCCGRFATPTHWRKVECPHPLR